MGLFSHCSRLTRELGPFLLWDKFPNATSGTFLNGEQNNRISEKNKKII